MFRNLITIGIRTILKGRIYSAINILSLTIGITCSVFLLLFILDELSYDRYHKNADDIFRVVSYLNYPDHTTSWAVAQIPLAEELRENYPEVSNVVRFFDIPRALYRVNDKQFYEDRLYFW